MRLIDLTHTMILKRVVYNAVLFCCIYWDCYASSHCVMLHQWRCQYQKLRLTGYERNTVALTPDGAGFGFTSEPPSTHYFKINCHMWPRSRRAALLVAVLTLSVLRLPRRFNAASYVHYWQQLLEWLITSSLVQNDLDQTNDPTVCISIGVSIANSASNVWKISRRVDFPSVL